MKKHGEKTVNPSIKIYINIIENKITFNIKTVYYLKFFTSEKMKLLGSTKSNMTKNKNDENVPNSEITQLVLVHSNIVNNNYQGSFIHYSFIRYFT